jgi:SAM-dependent methyltransferase
MNSNQTHWQSVYENKAEQQTSWFRPHLDESLRLIDGCELDLSSPIIDVGGGRSTLVDDLLDRGYSDLTVLDVSSAALAQATLRLGERADQVQWLAADISEADLPTSHYALWHDRALFHFLTEPSNRSGYITLAARSLRPGGYLMLATFATDGPDKCSGLPICRYRADDLSELFSENFDRVSDSREWHPTPFGTQQSFTYVLLRRKPELIRQ